MHAGDNTIESMSSCVAGSGAEWVYRLLLMDLQPLGEKLRNSLNLYCLYGGFCFSAYEACWLG